MTLLDASGQPVSNPAANLTALYATIGAVRVNGNVGQNPIRLQIANGAGGDAIIPPTVAKRITLSVSISQNAPLDQIAIAVLDTSGVFLRNTLSGERVALNEGDFTGERLHSHDLTLMSSDFQEFVHNYPNPFRAGSEDTRIAYSMPSDGTVSVKIYSLTGAMVWEAQFGPGDPQGRAGPQEIQWDGLNMNGEIVRNGVYVCQLEAGGQTAQFKIAVAK